MKQGEMTAVLLTARKLNFGIHWDVDESISFKLDMMIDTIELCILI